MCSCRARCSLRRFLRLSVVCEAVERDWYGKDHAADELAPRRTYVRADPIGLKGGMKTYTYVDQDPLDGLIAWGCSKFTATGAVRIQSSLSKRNLGFNEEGPRIDVQRRCSDRDRYVTFSTAPDNAT